MDIEVAIMNYENYPVIASNNYQKYLFFSEGPQGIIAKGVIYSQIVGDLFNLSFGDWNEGFQQMDDFTRTNNGDRNKVLATVAFTVIDFSRIYPDARLYIRGSTIGRTRLYQIGISVNFLIISELFNILGLFMDNWETFEKGRNYEAFLITKK
ncbi:DUF6934 family protein [Flavitalea flava]